MAAAQDILRQRLRTQRLVGPPFARAEDVVDWLVAVQSQDFAGAKWALGQRTAGATESELDRAFDAGAILRTHVMRPTWHFVRPADIRWLLALTAPRVRAILAHDDDALELDRPVRSRCARLVEAALRDGKSLTRAEIGALLGGEGIRCEGRRLAHLLAHLELDALICSGPRRGKQFTYALLEERAGPASALPHDEALALLVRRFFTGHGPATVRDCAWWSGLRMADVKVGIEAVRPRLEQIAVDGTTYCFADWWDGRSRSPVAHLLPNYDEYVIAYVDRSALVDPSLRPEPDSKLVFSNVVMVDGRAVGTWRRGAGKGAARVQTSLRRAHDGTRQAALRTAARRYERFLGLPLR
ncbi:MAG TPA: winged helix DNA-binding domain-containing protein [Myxococcaceae bacterium]|jgi:hypothetical protein